MAWQAKKYGVNPAPEGRPHTSMAEKRYVKLNISKDTDSGLPLEGIDTREWTY
ncbi:MAG: hypothetical protein AB1847_23520 [bacterium]